MIVATAGALGLLTGLHAATWGAYKDAPFEGFRWRSYVRSIVVGGVAALLLAATTSVESTQPAVLLVGLFYTLERLSTEWWKTILREDDQGAYSIPMRLGVGGRPVDSRLVRYLVGALIVVGLLGACWAVTAVQPLLPVLPAPLTVLIGGIGGWLTACGGAWKDAPIEGFSGWKFLRSPVVATAWAVPLSFTTDSWVLLTLAAGGFSVATIETYKTFLTGGRPPGKFATKPVRFHVPRIRRLLALMHATLWGTLAVAMVVQLSGPVPGSVGGWLADARHGALMVVAALSAVAAACVLGGHLRTAAASVRPEGPVRTADR